MAFPIIDLHCDVLYKYDNNTRTSQPSLDLDASIANLRAGHVKVQAYAIFVSPKLSKEAKRSNMLLVLKIMLFILQRGPKLQN